MIKRYVGTHALFQCSNVVPQAEHSKLFTSRDGAMISFVGTLRHIGMCGAVRS